jgi:ABC-type glycerol-3-phosphate transport system substrate-binding protein
MKKIIFAAAMAAAALGLTLCAGPVSSSTPSDSSPLSATHLLAGGIDPAALMTGDVRTTGNHQVTNGHEADAVVGPARGLIGS